MDLRELNDKIGGMYPITDLQFRFCIEYVKHGNGMRAIRDAGYNHSTPGSQSSAAYRLLKLDKIQKAIGVIQTNSHDE